MILSQFIRKHKKIDYLQKAIRHINDSNFVDTLIDYQRDFNVLKFDVNPKGTIDDNLYHIIVAGENDGFFSLYRMALEGMYYAMKLGFIPIVEYSKNIMYAEEDILFGTDNPYEYYFLQPTQYQLTDVDDFQRSIKWERFHVNLARSIGESDSYSISEKYLMAMAETTQRYIKLRPEIARRLEKDLETVLSTDNKVLGVHYRGTDFRQGYKNHPVFVSVEDYIKAIDDILENGDFDNKYSKIFLATDDLIALETFQNKYGDMVCCYGDTTRGTGETSIMYSQETRHNHNFELGYEVLRDMWTLAHCAGLVAGMSQVSICARITRRSVGERCYNDEIILDKGVNITGKVFSGK